MSLMLHKTTPTWNELPSRCYPRLESYKTLIGYCPKSASRVINQLFPCLPLDFKVVGYEGEVIDGIFIPYMTNPDGKKSPQFKKKREQITIYEIWVLYAIRVALAKKPKKNGQPAVSATYNQVAQALTENPNGLSFNAFRENYGDWSSHVVEIDRSARWVVDETPKWTPCELLSV